MDDHVQKLMDALPDTAVFGSKSRALQYAIETIEIERARLVEAVRAMRALPVTADDYPEARANEQSAALLGIDLALSFLRQAIETGERVCQIESERWEKRKLETERRLKQEDEERRQRAREMRKARDEQPPSADDD
jgi:hypothetical protein